ncbi:DUF1876 domain-containing protein [Rhodococcus sovatensis]|uniref:DUF1876 domain-containing protein n=1 Tax=Rhodococcus sovatensis TaxID=1805840 RepID=A0ABZ2PNL8_9NOCA
MEQHHWSVEVTIDEHDNKTRAVARLRTRDDTCLTGVGHARKSPVDPNVPEIGDELATARALSDLAHRLLECCSKDLEQVVHEPVSMTL